MFEARLLEEPTRQALRDAAAALDAAERSAQPLALSQAFVAMARCHAALPAPACAEAYLEMALRWARAAGGTDHTVDLLCELSETAVTLATALDAAEPGSGHIARERARDRVFEAAGLSPHVADSDWEVRVLLRLSDVLNRCGDHDDAALLQGRALARMATRSEISAGIAITQAVCRA